MDILKQIIKEIKVRKIDNQRKLNSLKLELIKKYKVKEIPKNTELIAAASSKDKIFLRKILTMKPSRTLSGVAVVAIMSKPIKCPHGACIMCPSYVDKGIPQSYTGKEPATRRAIRNKFDPYLQVFNRLEQYVVMNKIPEKVELIVMGGTFPSFPKGYKNEFITYAFKALNDFSKLFFKKGKLNFKKFKVFFELPGDIGSEERTNKIIKKILKIKKKTNLIKEQKLNEKAKIKCVGLTIETRSDYGKLKEGNELLKLGATRVELGIQSVYDEALKAIERGHSVKDNIEAIKTLKDLGFKLNFHYMPGLPGVDLKKDLKGMIQLFKDENYKPDMLKIYPCMVIPDTKLYKLWKKGKYKPLTTSKAAKLIVKFKRYVPVYCRIMRVQRDIPSYVIAAGVDRTNLRQYIGKHNCRCIRCREVGLKGVIPEKVDIFVEHYKASKGDEFFISAEDKEKDVLLGFCRMRLPSESLRKEITSKSALIRELHVYGEMSETGKKGLVQHKGLGKKLLKKAEEIAKECGKNKIVVISGVGAREYYKKLGYKLEGAYMVKKI